MEYINAFEGYEWVNGCNMYRGVNVSTGGYVYSEPGIYENVALLDVASLHPHSIIALNKLGKYTERYKALLEARIALKHHDYDAVRGMLGGVFNEFLVDDASADKLAQALKLFLNSIYGFCSASFPNPFKDSRDEMNIVALRGALFMKTLQDEIVKQGYQVVHVKTDSCKVPHATPEIIAFIQDFARKYGYEMEHEATYDRMCLTTKADYIAKYDQHGVRNKKGKHAGEWTATGAFFSHPYVFKRLFSHEEIEFKDICEIKEVKSQDGMFLDMNEGLPEGEHAYSFIGKVGLFVPIKPGHRGGELLVKRDDKYQAVAGTKGYRWLEAEEVKLLSKEEDIDMSYFHTLADKAIDAISQYGDFEHFVGDHGID